MHRRRDIMHKNNDFRHINLMSSAPSIKGHDHILGVVVALLILVLNHVHILVLLLNQNLPKSRLMQIKMVQF